jgi:hypothetical protein
MKMTGLSVLSFEEYLFLNNPIHETSKLLSMICLFLAISSLANAQTSKDEMIKEWERAKTYTKEYLDAMPESGYALKPTPEMRSFAEQMLHLTDGNYGFAAASGEKSAFAPGELEKTTDKSKANVSKIVLDGYDFVINSLKKYQQIKWEKRSNYLIVLK